jgi:hypothetical protein
MANNSDGKITNTSRKKTIRDALGIVMLVVPVCCSGVLREARHRLWQTGRSKIALQLWSRGSPVQSYIGYD